MLSTMDVLLILGTQDGKSWFVDNVSR